MTDRELLEKAAMALGYRTDHPMNAERLTLTPPVAALLIYRQDGLVHTGWNPITDDGCRYRLARDLGMCLDFYLGQVRLDGRLMQSFDPRNEIEEAYAIVRAAAAIGEAMP